MASLKRDEYIDMWNALMKLIPHLNGCADETCIICREDRKNIKVIKDKIQKVVGQLE